MDNNDIKKVIQILKKEVNKWKTPIVGRIEEQTKDPYRVLISCILSLRTKDATTEKASMKLFALADNPYQMVKKSPLQIRKAIYPVGFYNRKAFTIKEISKILIEKYNGVVPDTLDELLQLPGVGRKTANLVVTVAYKKQGICVDTHVHRIVNRWGYVKTKNPMETEMALRKKLPSQYWLTFNDLLVTYGQNLCKPVSPKCNECRISKFCDFYKNKKGLSYEKTNNN
ncbi:MAG: endonuclease III [Candidatus Cloacimonas sp. 4484_209]|nr:MAG: endonuclease III [Candidatus Cloacimonas sp. 4484_209]